MPAGPPVLNGRDGFSQKTPDPANASYYYSRPQLAVNGRIRIEGADLKVSGHAWLDHEWSSEILPETAQGWDWIGINLHDGGSLMAFRMRRATARRSGPAAHCSEGTSPRGSSRPNRCAFSRGAAGSRPARAPTIRSSGTSRSTAGRSAWNP